MNYKERVLFGCLFLLLPISGFACSMAEWDVPGTGAVTTASPPTMPRFSELCGMEATNTGYVQDNSPSTHSKFIARFYVRPNLTGSGQADLFVAYGAEDGTLPRIKVGYDGTNLNFLTGADVVKGTVEAEKNKWHLVEIEYNSGGTSKYWVNVDAAADAVTGSFTSATGTVESVRLGLPNGRTGFTGAVQFDSYESHSTTPVGPLLNGDANGNGSITISDVTRIGAELNGSLSPGQPDCNRNGTITISDVTCIGGLLN